MDNDHLYFVFEGTILELIVAGSKIASEPLHTIIDLLSIFGFGLTLTNNSKGKPLQEPLVGVIVYFAVWTLDVGFVNVPVIGGANEVVLIIPPVIPPVTIGKLDHE